jgi:hypothetical protein
MAEPSSSCAEGEGNKAPMHIYTYQELQPFILTVVDTLEAVYELGKEKGIEEMKALLHTFLANNS